jgi:uncharacterized lipoprotein YbaY
MKRNPTFIVLALGAAVLLAGCSANSPTAPPQPTPTAYGISLTATPSVAGINESILLVAQLTGSVPDGTSVTFTTTIGVFENGKQEETRTTSGGRATATLVTTVAGDGTVTARVPNKSDTTAVHFRGGSAAQLAITSVLPNRGRPQGGDQVVIHGQGFIAPVGVNFIVNTVAYPATIVSVAADGSSITVLTPQISAQVTLPAIADVQVTLLGVVKTDGTHPSATFIGGFTFAADFGGPLLYSVQPAVGSPLGGELIVLTGKNFTEPLQVDFVFPAPNSGTLQGRVVSVQHGSDGTDTANVITPRVPLGVTLPVSVDLTITSGAGTALSKSATYVGAFTYRGSANLKPAIFYISPTYGSVQGHETVLIYGQAFVPGATVTIGSTPETVVAVSDDGTVITITTTPVGGAVPTAAQDVTVVTSGGTATLPAAFTYLESQTPFIYGLTPNQGPLEGGTRVTITGIGFQYPVQVLFADRQAQVVSSNYNQVVCISPSVTAGGQATPQTVSVTVTNLKSGKVSAGANFRYGEAMYISGLSPVEGPADQATMVTISGQGFVAPVSVIAKANVQLQWDVTSVSGTEIVAMSKPIPESARACSDVSATITVTNLGSNITATATQPFTYRAIHPLITSVQIDSGGNQVTQYVPVAVPPSLAVCSTTWTSHTVTVRGSGFQTSGGSSAMVVKFNDVGPVPATFVDSSTLTLQLPDLTAIPITQITCTTAAGTCGTRFIPTPVNVTVTNQRNGCSDTLVGAIVINPCDSVTCLPTAFTSLIITPLGTTQVVGAVFTVTLAFAPSPSTVVTNVTLQYVGFNGGPTSVVIPANVASPRVISVIATSAGIGTIEASVGSGVCELTAVSVPITVLGPAPTVTLVAPATGAAAGGTLVNITGTNFATTGTVTVTFGGVAATGVTVVNSTTITCTTPAHAAGAVNVVVTNPDTQSGTMAGGFTYT